MTTLKDMNDFDKKSYIQGGELLTYLVYLDHDTSCNINRLHKT